MAHLHAAKPESGAQTTFTPTAGDSLVLSHPEASPLREGDHLVLSYADGASIVVLDYFLIPPADRPSLLLADNTNLPPSFDASMQRLNQAVPSSPEASDEPGNADADQAANPAAGPTDANAGQAPAYNDNNASNGPDQASNGKGQSKTPQSQGQHSGEIQETNFQLFNDLPFEIGITRLPGLDLGWTRDFDPRRYYEGAPEQDDDDAWGSAGGVHPNTPPHFIAESGAIGEAGGAEIAFAVREAGVKGDATDLVGSDANAAVAGSITASGTVHAQDADGDSLSYSLSASSTSGGGGSGSGLNSLTTRYGNVTIDANGAYSYTLDPLRSNRLAQDAQDSDSFYIVVSDGKGGMIEQAVTVTITGTNDAPVLSFATGNGEHFLSMRGSAPTQSGATLGVDDADSDGGFGGNTLGVPNQRFSINGTAGSAAGGTENADGSAVFVTEYGTLTLQADGSYSYSMNTAAGSAMDRLPDGSDYKDIFTVTVKDVHGSFSSQTITVNLHKGNATPIFDVAPGTLNLKEAGLANGGNTPVAGTDHADGSASGHDNDDPNSDLVWGIETSTLPSGCSSSINGTTQTITTPYGTLTLDTTSGAYQYRLDNSNAATQKLAAGAKADQNFSLTLKDPHGGTATHQFTVSIEGTNDAPILSFAYGTTGIHSLTDPSSGPAQAGGTFTVADADSDGTLGSSANGKANQQFSVQDADSGLLGTPAADGSVNITTAYGTLHIAKDGSYTYTLNTSSQEVIALGGTQSHTENFIIQITDRHGAVSETKNISVEITGKNDPPKVSGATGTHSVVEAGVASGNLDMLGTPSVSGTLSAEHTDGDANGAIIFGLSQTVVITVGGNSQTVSIVPSDNGCVIETAYGTLTLRPGAGVNGKFPCDYQFQLNNGSADVNTLPEGEQLSLSFTVQATDNGKTHNEDLIITVTGTNDRPVISSVGSPSALTEDGMLKISSSTVTATDPDTGDSISYSLLDSDGNSVQILKNDYGRLEIIQGSGDYTFHLDNASRDVQALAAGETGYAEFTVRVTDSRGAYTDAVIKIPITGVDDKPVFGNLSNAITEDNGSHAATPVSPVPDVSGKVTASDIDRLDSEQVFSLTGTTSGTPSTPVSGTGTADDPYVVQGKYGSLTFYADGSYSYKLTENAHTDIQAMNDEDSKTESFTIRVGTGHNGTISSESTGSLNIEIKGSNDNPVVTGFNNLTLNTGNSISPTVSGTLTITDVDDLVNQTATGNYQHSFYFLHNGQRVQSMVHEGTTGFGVLTIDQFTGKYVYTLNQYAPGLNVGGTEKFTITVEDAHGGTTEQEVTVEILPVTGPPPSPGLSYTLTGPNLGVTEDGFSTVNGTNVLAVGQATLSNGPGAFGFAVAGNIFSQTVTGKYGTITIDDSGRYTYTLNNTLDAVQQLRAGGTLADETFQLWGSGSSTIIITITGTNDQPSLSFGTGDGTLTLQQVDGQDVSVSGNVVVKDIDSASNGESHSYWLDSACTQTEVFYSFTIVNGIITGYVPDVQAHADFKISVDSSGRYTLTYLQNGQHLTLDDNQKISFDVYAKDNSGASNAVSDKMTVSADITGTNAAPKWITPLAAAVTEDLMISGKVEVTGILLSQGGVNDDTGTGGLFFSINNNGALTSLYTGTYGTLHITDSASGAYSYVLNNALNSVQSLGAGESHTETFTVRVTDKHGGFSEQTITVTINGTNDAPKLGALANLHTTATADVTDPNDPNRWTTASNTALGTDIDANDTLSYSFAAASGSESYANYGEFILGADGVYSFRLDNTKDAVRALTDSQSKELSFVITVTDSQGASASQTVKVLVNGVDDAPVVKPGLEGLPVSSGTGGTNTGDFDSYIVDPEGAILSFTASFEGGTAGTSIAGKYGTLVIQADGSYTYTLNAGVNDAANEVFTLHVNGTHAHDTLSTKLVFAINGGAPASFSLFSHGETEAESLDSLLGAAAALPESIAPAYAAAASGNALGSATFATAAAPGTSAAELSAWTAQSWSEPSTQPSELHDMELVMAKLSMEQGL